MPTVRTKTFRSGNSQAVRLPRDVAFEGDDVELVLVRSGDVLTIYPATKKSAAEMIKQLGGLPAPPRPQERDNDVIPERSGL
jgi:antitoxin VapB